MREAERQKEEAISMHRTYNSNKTKLEVTLITLVVLILKN